MKFGPAKTKDAVGGILAHSLRVGIQRFPKGMVLGAGEISALVAAGITEVTIATVEVDDLGEDLAAERIAAKFLRRGISVTEPVAGRVNLVAEQAGILRVNSGAINAMNSVDEALTVATLPDYAHVEQNALIATIKVIPYGVHKSSIDQFCDLAKADVFCLHPFRPLVVDLIMTRTKDFKESLIQKGRKSVADRIASMGLHLRESVVVDHETAKVAAAIRASTADLILVLAASATSDRNDVIPAAIQRAGGQVVRFGMPVDPGNLLVLGKRENGTIVGLPGCARAPALNGADWVLERLAAQLDVSHHSIAQMGVGGLLKEIPQRIQPRAKTAQHQGPQVGLLLAAGSSSRMGSQDKLLRQIDGISLLRRSSIALLDSDVSDVYVTIQAGSELHREALADLPVTIVEVHDAAVGMSASIRGGMAAIPVQTRAVVVGLADMPEITPTHYNSILAAHDPAKNHLIVCPVTPDGRRGHPVLFDMRFSENLQSITGDQGARQIIQAVPEFVHEVRMDSQAVVCDLDTPEAWKRWQARRRP